MTDILPATFILGFIILFLFYILSRHLAMQVAYYRLVSVKDDLLVSLADKKMNYHGEVFNHFYPTIKKILMAGPYVNLLDIKQDVLSLEKPESANIDYQIMRYTSLMKALVERNKLSNTQERDIVNAYFEQLRQLVISRSVFIDTLFTLFEKKGLQKIENLHPFIRSIIPTPLLDGLKLVYMTLDLNVLFQQPLKIRGGDYPAIKEQRC